MGTRAAVRTIARTKPGWSSALKTFGPGIVFVLTVLGPGDFVSNAVAGATYGCGLLWVLAAALLFRFVWLDASARYVMATGQTLMDGYATVGPWAPWLVLGAMIVVRLAANFYKLVLLGDIVRLVLPQGWPLPGPWLGALIAAAAWAACGHGRYTFLEKCFKPLTALMGGALLAAALLARPRPDELLMGLAPSWPSDGGDYGAAFLLLALIGTEAGSLTNITYSYFLRQKGWTHAAWRARQVRDLLFSVGCLFLFSAATQIAAAGALRPAGIVPRDAGDLVRVFTHALGEPGRWIFAFGLLAAALTGILGATTGYALAVSDFLRRFRPSDREGTGRDPVYRVAVAFWCFAPLPLLWLDWRPVWLVLASSALMGACIPLLAVLLLRLTWPADRMAALRPGIVMRSALVLLAAASGLLLILNLLRRF